MSVKDLTLDLVVRYGFQVLGAVVILAAGVVLAKWVGSFVQRWLARHEMEPPVRMLAVRIIRVIVLLLALLIALDKLGFQIAPLIAGIGVAGLGIGIALQGVLSNLIAGLSIIFTKPYRVGQHIALLGVHGDVATIDLFSTTLINPDRSRVVIPNRKIVGEILHNFGSIRQLELSVGVAYATDLNQALAVVQELLARNPRVLKEPEPYVGVSTLGDTSITIAIRPWVSAADYMVAQAELNQAIIERFRASHIEIPFPQREVRLLGGS
jgi:small conductance mechanosensitive channel